MKNPKPAGVAKAAAASACREQGGASLEGSGGDPMAHANTPKYSGHESAESKGVAGNLYPGGGGSSTNPVK